MNTRSCLLTVGVSTLLATGTVLTAAPASAAPGSAECVAAQAALSTQLGVASVDITLANQLRDAINAFDSIDAQLYPLYAEAELSTQDELEALDAAVVAEAQAGKRLEDATIALNALLAAEPQDPDAVAEAEHEKLEAEVAYPLTETALLSADAAYSTALDAAYTIPAILNLEEQFDIAVASFEEAFAQLGLTEGADPEQLLALADAAVAACSAPVANKPAVTVSAPQQRGLNIQTAAYDAGASDPANLALLAGLAGLGAAAVSGAVVVRRRRNARA
ncbi:hypothetical protein [Arthrobacter sp. D2-10]